LILDIYHILFRTYKQQYWWPAESQDEIIIGTILTQNTNWNNVTQAINNLKNHDMCSVKEINSVDTGKLASLIKPSGYYNLKTKRLKALCNFLTGVNLANLETKIARRLLLNVNGIGYETADSILLYAYDKPIFVIDTYTVRLFNRLIPETKLFNYEDMQHIFHKHLPVDTHLFNEYHALIVRHGKEHCKKRQQICDNCCIKDICQYTN